MQSLRKGGVYTLMSSSKSIINYKRKLAALLVNNERIVYLINNDEVKNSEDLIYKNIFNFVRVPNAPEEQLNYICFKIDMPEVYTVNMFFQKLIVEIYVVSHQGEMVTDEGATRIDLIGEEIEEMLDGYDGFGKKPLELISNVEEGFGTNHRCRVMRFEAFDTDRCG